VSTSPSGTAVADAAVAHRSGTVHDTPGTVSAPAPARAFDASLPWELSPQVSLRPESFGALAYHFGTRRLSFLKSPVLLDVVRSLGDLPSAVEALREAGVPADQREAFERALATLADTDMIRVREAT
jgi:putative mycofactocin binding protein MftB